VVKRMINGRGISKMSDYLEELKHKINESPEYEFLKTNKHLGENICILTLGGSYAYGTNVEGSDIDVRGIAISPSREIIIGKRSFEQIIDNPTDTTVYEINKMISLLSQCNPNCIEILGCKPEQYFILTDIGQKLLDNKKIFLSKRCVHTFGGYATSQLRRLENISNKYVQQSAQEQHILDSINNARYDFPEHYFPMGDGFIDLYIDDAVTETEEFEKEIFMDINLKHYPLRDYANMWNEMKSIVSSYNRIGKRNRRALDHNKIGKHMMHLIRLYFMCIDILEKQEINTYREKEHDLLMEIRNGKYIDENQQPIPEFSEMVDDLEKKLKYAAENTELPETANIDAIEELMFEINSSIIEK